MNNRRLLRRSYSSLQFRHVIVCGVIVIFFPMMASGVPGDSLQSLAPAIEMEKMLYELKFERIEQKIIVTLKENAAKAVTMEIFALLNQVKIAADSADYFLAGLLLDQVEDAYDLLLAMDEASPISTPGTNSTNFELSPWHWQAFSGSDFWQNRYNLAWGFQDSLISEGEGNPFTGLRLGYETGHYGQNLFESDFQVKFSRDYLTGDLTSKWQKRFNATLLEVTNRVEGTSYLETWSPHYLDEKFQAGLTFPVRTGLKFETCQNINYRSFSEQTNFYATFLEYETKVGADYSPTPFSSIGVRYYYRNRKHSFLAEKDYRENNVVANLFSGWDLDKNFYLRVDYRNRCYEWQIDSLYTKNYARLYADLEGVYPITAFWGLATRFSVEQHCYAGPSNNFPNYHMLELEPAFTFNLSEWIKIKIGYLYRRKSYNMPEELISATGAFQNVTVENYYGNGIVLGCDVFKINGLIFSLQNTLEMRRFPNSVTRDIHDFSLYSDRNMTNLMLFFTWPISHHFETNCIANIDHDTDRKEQSNDSRSTLFSVELIYRF